DVDMHQIVAGKVGEQVQVPQNQSVLGNHTQGMSIPGEDFKDIAGDFEFFLQGLIAIGVARNRNGYRLPLRMENEFFEQRRGIFLDDNLALKIQACTESPILMCVARITVDAT